jgi:hypothetical protein
MSDRLVTEAANYPSCDRDKRGATTLSAGFETAIPARERPQTDAIDRAATGSEI